MAKYKSKCLKCGSFKYSTCQRTLLQGEGACKCNSIDYSKFKKQIPDMSNVRDIMDNEVHKFTILGNPGIKKNSQRIIMSGIRPSIAYELWAGQAIFQIQNYLQTYPKWQTLNGPIHMEAQYYRNTKRDADLSNLHEGIQDCLTMAGFWLDDSLIESHDGSRKHYDKNNPRIEVTIKKFK